LVEQLWRVKTPEVEQFLKTAISDPTVTRAAGAAWRRLVGKDEAERLLLRRVDADDDQVASAGRDHLKRVDRARKKRS
jgi:hypothetical protein